MRFIFTPNLLNIMLMCCKDITLLGRRTLWTRHFVFYYLEKKVFCSSNFLAYFSFGFYL